MSDVKIDSEVSRVDGQLSKKELPQFPLENDPHPEHTAAAVKEITTSIEQENKNVSEAKAINLNTLRIATQVRELVLQGVTLKNTLKDMHEVWMSLYSEDKKCLIVEMQATKVRAQLINLYAIKLIKYVNSIIGLDLVPLSQQVNPASADMQNRDPATFSWKMDSILLNICSNKIDNHEHLFKLLMINLFGLSEQVIEFALNPTWEGLREIIIKTYDIDLGDTEGVTCTPELELVEGALYNYLSNPEQGYKAY